MQDARSDGLRHARRIRVGSLFVGDTDRARQLLGANLDELARSQLGQRIEYPRDERP
jgi:hypothetical protein